VKVARRVLRGSRGSNAPGLPDHGGRLSRLQGMENRSWQPVLQVAPTAPESAIERTRSGTERRDRSATRGRTLRVDSQKGGSTDDVDCVVPGQCSRPVPTRTCVAGDGGVRSSGEKPKGPRSIRGLQARGRPDG